jgi:hypothetical protein
MEVVADVGERDVGGPVVLSPFHQIRQNYCGAIALNISAWNFGDAPNLDSILKWNPLKVKQIVLNSHIKNVSLVGHIC